MDNSTGGITKMRPELTEDELKYLASDLTMYKIVRLIFPVYIYIYIYVYPLSFQK